MMSRYVPSLAALLRLDARDRVGLEWVRKRTRFWLTALKRRRDHLPQDVPHSTEETAEIQALSALEKAASRVLEISDGRQDCSSTE